MLAVNCVRIAIRAFGNLVNLAWSCPWLRCGRARCVFPVACPFVYVHVLIADCWSCYRRRILWASLGQRDRPAVDRSGLEVSLSSLSLSHQCVQRFFRIYIYTMQFNSYTNYLASQWSANVGLTLKVASLNLLSALQDKQGIGKSAILQKKPFKD